MRLSPLGTLILWFHTKAEDENRLEETNPVARDLIQVLDGTANFPAGKPLSEGAILGIELFTGNARSEVAKAIRRQALGRLYNYNTFTEAVVELGYIPPLIRTALAVHYGRLQNEPLGTMGNAIYIDLLRATAALEADDLKIVTMLISGIGPQKIGELTGTNGSRVLGKVLRQMSRYLEGDRYGDRR
jgi:hypothetical protein